MALIPVEHIGLTHNGSSLRSIIGTYRITLLGHRGLTYIGLFDEILMVRYRFPVLILPPINRPQGLSISETVQLGGARGLNLRLLPFIKEKNAFWKTHTNARFILLRSGLSGLREPLRCPFSCGYISYCGGIRH